MKVDLFDFELPEECIALHPVSPRDRARLLEVRPGGTPELADHCVSDLPGLLEPGDVLVVNNTSVLAAALSGVRLREDSQARISVNLHKRLDGHRWAAFVRPAKRMREGDRLRFTATGGRAGGDNACLSGMLEAVIETRRDGGEMVLAFDLSGAALDDAIAALGAMPLPPYIASKREVEARDAEDYQTMFAAREGAVAAPTAGLHFTHDLLAALAARGVEISVLTLHVGAGTFLPVKVEDSDDHKMHGEWGEVTPDVARRLNEARAKGGRIVAVGTTSLRLLETAVDGNGQIQPFAGDTDIFITPGYEFGAVDLVMTNFHLPRSTLFMLVSAFSGLEVMKRAYAHAIGSGYRFYSYGDCCLLHPGTLAEAGA